jgi:hypothetical protein
MPMIQLNKDAYEKESLASDIGYDEYFSITRDLERQSGDFENKFKITKDEWRQQIQFFECGLCTPTFSILNEDGEENTVGVYMDEDANIVIDTTDGFVFEGEFTIQYLPESNNGELCSDNSPSVSIPVNIVVCG